MTPIERAYRTPIAVVPEQRPQRTGRSRASRVRVAAGQRRRGLIIAALKDGAMTAQQVGAVTGMSTDSARQYLVNMAADGVVRQAGTLRLRNHNPTTWELDE